MLTYSFKFNICFMAQNVLCLVECSMYTSEECAFSCCGVFCKRRLVPAVGSIVRSKPIFCLSSLSVTERGVLRTRTVIVDLSVSSFGSASFYFTC